MDHLKNPILIEGTSVLIYVFEFGMALESGAAHVLRSQGLLIIDLFDDRELSLTLLALVGVAALLLFNKER